MIVDSSAVLAVLFGEPDAGHYEKTIAAAPTCRMSAANRLETAIVVESYESYGGTAAGVHRCTQWVKSQELRIVLVARFFDVNNYFQVFDMSFRELNSNTLFG